MRLLKGDVREDDTLPEQLVEQTRQFLRREERLRGSDSHTTVLGDGTVEVPAGSLEIIEPQISRIVDQQAHRIGVGDDGVGDATRAVVVDPDVDGRVDATRGRGEEHDQPHHDDPRPFHGLEPRRFGPR